MKRRFHVYSIQTSNSILLRPIRDKGSFSLLFCSNIPTHTITMSTSEQGLAIAQIAFYAAISIPALYCLISHGRHGLMGWIYVLAMCGLRLAGNAMSLNAYHNHEVSPSASIINGIGLSPLLMASLGLLHESYVLYYLLAFIANCSGTILFNTPYRPCWVCRARLPRILSLPAELLLQLPAMERNHFSEAVLLSSHWAGPWWLDWSFFPTEEAIAADSLKRRR